MKTAVIHDWLVTYGGADRVLEQIISCFPQSDLFSLVDFLPPPERKFFLNKTVTTSFIQRLPLARRSFRKYFGLMPLAVEQFDLSPYDLVISNSHCVAKGVITGAEQVHICYCHSPVRYAWDLQHEYLEESGLDRGINGWAARWMLHRMRMWDIRTANGVDSFIANSRFIARRIWKVYRRNATVIYPPVDVDFFSLREKKEDFYLTVSRLVPYKKVNVIVEVFNKMPDKKLLVVGDGPQYEKIKTIAGKNVEMLGFQDVEVVRQLMQCARAFIFAAQEDFGICVAEAQACGTPVIAFGKGGAQEIVSSDVKENTGVFFWEQTAEAIVNAVRDFDNHRDRFAPSMCRANAVRFSTERFREEFSRFCDLALSRYGGKTRIQPEWLGQECIKP